MIHVARSEEPDGFRQRAQDWERRFTAEQTRDPQLSISKFWAEVRREIRPDAAILFRNFYGKCAFCESKMAHVSSPHIEHYWPKSKFPQRTFVWRNWLLSCGKCNEKKWAKTPFCDAIPCLINPTIEEPQKHIGFVGAITVEKTERGKKTIELLGLKRQDLEEERSHWLDYLRQLLLLVTIPNFRQAARDCLIWAMQPEAPYSAMTRDYLNEKTPRLAHPIQPHPHVDLPDGVDRIKHLIDENIDALRALE